MGALDTFRDIMHEYRDTERHEAFVQLFDEAIKYAKKVLNGHGEPIDDHRLLTAAHRLFMIVSHWETIFGDDQSTADGNEVLDVLFNSAVEYGRGGEVMALITTRALWRASFNAGVQYLSTIGDI